MEERRSRKNKHDSSTSLLLHPSATRTDPNEAPPAPDLFDHRVVSFYESLPKRAWPFSDGRVPAMHLGYWGGKVSGHAEALERMNRELAERAGITRGERVLDAGCGCGASAVWLAREVGAEVVGVNIAPGQLYRARRAARSLGLSGTLSFEHRDFAATGFPDASFDVVWAIESVCHAEDKERFISEARRLLAPGGRLVVADFFRSARPFEADEEELVSEWLSGWAVPDLSTVGEFREFARLAGFADVRFEDATENVRPSARRIRRRAMAARPVAGMMRAMGVGGAGLVSLARAGLRQYEALRRGLWSYGIIVADGGGE